MTDAPDADPRVPPERVIDFHFETLGSTNDEAQRLYKSHPQQIVRVSATEQTAARGSRRRTWVSPRGGAWFSLAVPIKLPQQAAPLVIGQALLKTLATYADDLTLKAPNDILHNRKKLAGILCEQTLMPGEPQTTVIIGVGINANFDTAELGPDLRTPPTSLREILGRDVDLETLIESATQAILSHLQS